MFLYFPLRCWLVKLKLEYLCLYLNSLNCSDVTSNVKGKPTCFFRLSNIQYWRVLNVGVWSGGKTHLNIKLVNNRRTNKYLFYIDSFSSFCSQTDHLTHQGSTHNHNILLNYLLAHSFEFITGKNIWLKILRNIVAVLPLPDWRLFGP